MRSFKALMLGLAFIFGAALVYQAVGIAAETALPAAGQKTEQKIETKHKKKGVSAKKKKSKKMAEAVTTPAPPAPSAPDSSKKS